MKEKEINRSFWKNTSIFLAPMKKEKKVTFKAIFYYLVMASYPIFHIFVIQKLVFFIEHKDKGAFMNLMIIYGILNIFYEIIYLLTKDWSWVVTIGNYKKVIHKEYLSRFVTLLNTESEKIWTWKWIAIIDKWIENWSTILDDLIKNSLNIVVAFSFSLYTVLKIDIFYGLVFLIIYLFIHFIWWYINTFTIIHRR